MGRQLHSPRLAILALILAAIAPRLVSLRVNFTLDLALTAVTTLALWQLWRWQRHAPHGGHWLSGMLAAFGLAAALLVKQSAVLVLAAPTLWTVATGMGEHRRRRPQRRWLDPALAAPELDHRHWRRPSAVGMKRPASSDASPRFQGESPIRPAGP
ncbi:MAG: glycosyltransferase family 39 protein [Cyanobacteria bacterium MAG CAR1_bin_15]|nr:glycosyltransferase family 39 protein [Cyanobacteria bacterium MAG CAR1_bin_15]